MANWGPMSRPDPFVDRSFGHNFDVDDEWDRAFIDEVHARDEAGFAQGTLTPTHMFAVLDSKNEVNAREIVRCVRNGDAGDAPVAAAEVDDRLGRVLRELETERRRLADVVQAKSKEVEFLHDELVKRTEWAWGMEKELNERTHWAMALDKRITDLTKRLGEKKGWFGKK
jgi:hypothetical protein